MAWLALALDDADDFAIEGDRGAYRIVGLERRPYRRKENRCADRSRDAERAYRGHPRLIPRD
jgi:hypothetical protein